jgi:hypothetical protein
MRTILILFLFAACNRSEEDGMFSFLALQDSKPAVIILPVVDGACNFTSSKVAQSFTDAVYNRLEQRTPFFLKKEKKPYGQFLVEMQLIELEEMQATSELVISMHVKILDLRTDKPKVILQEVLNVNTLLERPLSPRTLLMQNNEEFRISPMGLAHAKLTREIARRIEESISSQIRTN